MVLRNLRELGRFDEARVYCQKATDIGIRAFGKKHTQTMKCQLMLAHIEWELALIIALNLVPSHLEQGNITKAPSLCDRCFVLRPESVSPLNSQLGQVYLWKATYLKQFGKYEEYLLNMPLRQW